MKPIKFISYATLQLTPGEIARQILDLDKWREFPGWGLLPSIRSAEFEVKTPEIVGTRIRVVNSDGSRHVEQIVAWLPGETLQLHMVDFSPPLSRLATHFVETWVFKREDATFVSRIFELYPRSWLTRLPLTLIAWMLKRAIKRHGQIIANGAARPEVSDQA